MLKIDLKNCGLEAAELGQWNEKLEASQVSLDQGASAGKRGLGWQNLPLEADETSKTLGEKLRHFRFLILIGIGGSALGTQMLISALMDFRYPWNDHPAVPSLFVADNLDAAKNNALWDSVDPASTALVVVSKSGYTLETLGNFLFFRARLARTLGEGPELERRIFAVTDPEEGLLRRYVTEQALESLPLPPAVGGRYSVLSSASLPLAWALGIDGDQLKAGAAAMKKSLEERRSVGSNPAWAMAAWCCAHYQRGRQVTVFMPYGDRLKRVGDWFGQLWGESLGKGGIGFTPQAVLGSIDQHSQLQLYMEGPDDKVYIFLNVGSLMPDAFEVPPVPSLQEAAYLQGLPLEKAMDHERRGTMAALALQGRPLCGLEMERMDEWNLGGLIYFLETVTALTGFLLGINPFDQPGVEEGKGYALALCGHPQWKEQLAALAKAEASNGPAFQI